MAARQKVDDEWQDVEWEDVPETTPITTPVTTPVSTTPAPVDEEPGFLSKAWRTISEPITDAPSRFARGVADYIDAPSLERSPTMARIKGFGAGAVEGIGDLVSGFTSPINLGTAALTGGNTAALRAGLPRIAQAMRAGARTSGALTATHGAGEVLRPDVTIPERLMGGVEMAGGGLGMRAPKSLKVKPPEQIRVNAPELLDEVAETIAAKPKGPRILKTPPTKQQVDDLLSKGYIFDDLNDKGHFIFKYIREPEGPLETTVGQTRPTPKGAREQLGVKTDVAKASPLVEAMNFPRSVMASIDMSAPLRQGLPLWHKWKFSHFTDMARAWGSEDFFNAAQKEISERPLFRTRVGKNNKMIPSFAEEAGLKLTDLTDLSKREEAIMSTWAERIPVLGRGVRASNRAYTVFLNKLRADTFESLVHDGKVFQPGLETNVVKARALADFVNYASGRGSLGRAERAAVILNTGFFAPRLIASRLKILNPWTYVNPRTDSQVRKEAIKSLFALATAGNTVVQLAKLGGLEVEQDPASSDFGKVKIGNTRLDPWAGAQQYIVAANRILKPQGATIGQEGGTNTGIAPIDLTTGMFASPGGKFKSSISGSEYMLGEKYGGSDRLDVGVRFVEGKLNPIFNFVTGLMRGKDLTGKPFNVPEEVVKRFIPIFIQDLKELITENPNLIPGIHEEPWMKNIHIENLPAAIPPFFGMGMQHYGPTDD